jgi:hypothetical protein
MTGPRLIGYQNSMSHHSTAYQEYDSPSSSKLESDGDDATIECFDEDESSALPAKTTIADFFPPN